MIPDAPASQEDHHHHPHTGDAESRGVAPEKASTNVAIEPPVGEDDGGVPRDENPDDELDLESTHGSHADGPAAKQSWLHLYLYMFPFSLTYISMYVLYVTVCVCVCVCLFQSVIRLYRM